MKSIEFRNETTHRYSRIETDDNQLVLPLDVDLQREVHWLHGEQITRRRLWGSKVITHLIMHADSHLPRRTYIDAAAIGELNDPDLRYALRLADATEAVGWTPTSETTMGAHDVWITATDAGVDSKLLNATYTGIVSDTHDTFMQNLHNAAPNR